MEKVESDTQLKKTLFNDWERLCDGEDSFQWPLDDPHYRLLLGDLSKPFPLVTPELEAPLRELGAQEPALSGRQRRLCYKSIWKMPPVTSGLL